MDTTGSPRHHTPMFDDAFDLDRREFFALAPAFAVILGLEFVPAGRATDLARAIRTDDPITLEMIEAAERLLGLSFTDSERAVMLEGLGELRDLYADLRAVSIPNDVHPAIAFDPLLPGRTVEVDERDGPIPVTQPQWVFNPDSLESLAFEPVTVLTELIRTRRVSSEELTRMYLDRLARYGPKLECVVTLTGDRALHAARRADAEIAAGTYRGPLHGIPWGAKDLLSARGAPTTWGAYPFRHQTIDEDATVVRKLDEAGAVLVAKLTLGALAWGDVWFGGKTRNPWNLEQGSGGSSAGSATATVAGLVGFSIGSETLGSIVSPSTRTGATGLRPTFGRVSRHGAMALSWTMDKLGPICRSVEDCAIVFEAIRGTDGRDPTVRDAPFDWDPDVGVDRLRVGYLKSAFEQEEDHETKPFDDRALEVLETLGVDLIPIELPDQYPISPMRIILTAEAAAAFDELTRSGRDDELVRQIENAWPNVFRRSRLIPAVEYIQANRVRTRVMEAMEKTFEEIDVLVAPTFAENLVLLTNLTGHPAVVVPNGFRDDGTPVSISFIGRLFGEAEVLGVARRYQDATGFHLRRPPGFV